MTNVIFPELGTRKNKKRGESFDSPLGELVRWARLELAQAYAHYPLKVACLPFHHHRFVCFGIAKVRTFFKLPNFFAKIFKYFSRNFREDVLLR